MSSHLAIDKKLDRSPAATVWAPRMLSVLRMVAAVLFLEHGTQKMFGFPASGTPLVPYHVLTQNGVAGILETFGGLALLFGLRTRPVAFLLAGEMAVAYFQVHVPRSLFPIVNRGDTPVLFCFIFLYLVAAGGGAWSLDNALAVVQLRALFRPRAFDTTQAAAERAGVETT